MIRTLGVKILTLHGLIYFHPIFFIHIEDAIVGSIKILRLRFIRL